MRKTDVAHAIQDKVSVIKRETWKLCQLMALIEKKEFRGMESVDACAVHRDLTELAGAFESRIPEHMKG